MSDATRTTPTRLPIKVIGANQGQERRVKGGGSKPVPFRPVTPEFRGSLSTQVAKIREALAPQLERAGAAPMRVQLLSRALAKTHRPEKLFTDNTCPIIGTGTHGELFLKATPAGLANLTREIQQNTSERIAKDISTIQAIEAITPAQRRKKKTPKEVLQTSPRVKDGFLTRVRLFDFGHSRDQLRLVADFEAACQANNLPANREGYSEETQVYAVTCRTEEDVDTLSRIVGVRSIIGMPRLRTIRTKAFNEGPQPADLPLATAVEGDFPSVVVVDSGIARNIATLETWVAGRSSSVVPPYQNPTHGTFVAGLIVWGDRLNPHLPDIDSGPCGVFDLQVIPNADAEWGDTESVTEQEFLQTLETALKQHANRYKVWNLSLSTSEVCAEDEFSAFAEELDNLQEKYQVTFVIAAGNYETLPLLDFPRVDQQQLSAGRITAPADSVLGVTVGSISHLDYAGRGPKREEPSPFSRHGAGPNHIIKPDLVHYGGTCTTDAQHVGGVRSITLAGAGEDIGTSFAAPLVSRSLAQIYHQITPTPSPVLARALLTHHARDPRSNSRVPVGDENFIGFGRPVPPPYCLACEPHQSTLIFDDALRPGFFLEWDDFPYPPSLYRGGKYYGEVFMTIAFAPARGGRWGTEYCETHVDAHFGVYRTTTSRPDENGQRIVREKFHGLVPPEHANPSKLFEEVQIKELRKWAPVRTYHGDMGSNGERGSRWRLKVQLLTRHGVEEQKAQHSQPFALIVTIVDPERKAPVYDEMAQLIRSRYQSQNLTVRAGARIRTQS